MSEEIKGTQIVKKQISFLANGRIQERTVIVLFSFVSQQRSHYGDQAGPELAPPRPASLTE